MTWCSITAIQLPTFRTRLTMIVFFLLSRQPGANDTALVAVIRNLSHRHWGTCPVDFQLFYYLSGHFRAAIFEIGLYMVACLCPIKNIQAYSFVTVHCMNFIIFCVSPLNSFILSFTPLPAPNPGDATDLSRRHFRFLVALYFLLLHCRQLGSGT